MSTREYLDEVIEVLKKEYGVSQERAEKMIDDTYFAFKIEFNPYMYSDIALSDVARLIVRTFSNPEFRYQRFYDRVVEHLIRDYVMNADTAIQVMSFNNSKDVFMNHKDTIDGVYMRDLKVLAGDFYDRYKAGRKSEYYALFHNVRDTLLGYGLSFDEVNSILTIYSLEYVYDNLVFNGNTDVSEKIDLIAKSAIQFYIRST